MIFFGCWNPRQLGHHFYSPSGITMYSCEPFAPGEFDTGFHDRDAPGNPQFYIADRHEPEEPLTLTKYVRNGQTFTVLGCWDRSADQRPNSKAAFIMEGEHDKATMVRTAQEKFPAITARLKAFQVGAERGWS